MASICIDRIGFFVGTGTIDIISQHRNNNRGRCAQRDVRTERGGRIFEACSQWPPTLWTQRLLKAVNWLIGQ